MLTLTIRTDKPEAEIGLYKSQQKLAYHRWLADRQLAETIHQRLDKLLKGQKLELENIEAIVAFQGPGSFTGLRIGISVANALAMALDIPIVATNGETWLEQGLERVQNGQND